MRRMRRLTSPYSWVLTAGLLLATLGLAAYSIEVTVLDGRRATAVAPTLLKTGFVRDEMSGRVASAISGDQPLSPVDSATVKRTADRAVTEPEFIAAFQRALGALHAEVFGDRSGPIVLDQALVRSAVQHAVVVLDPTGSGPAGANRPLTVTIDTEAVPHLATWGRLVRNLARFGGVLGLVLVAVGFSLEGHRARALMRIGRWALVWGLLGLVAVRLVPDVVLPRVGSWAEVAGKVAGGGGGVLVPIALALCAAGLFLIVIGARWEGTSRRSVLAVIPHAPRRHATAADHTWRSRV